MTQDFYDEMRRLGFAFFSGFTPKGAFYRTWEDRTLLAGGIRITVVDDLADIWCPQQNFLETTIQAYNVLPIVHSLLQNRRNSEHR